MRVALILVLCMLLPLGAAADSTAAIERVTVAQGGGQPNGFSEPAEAQAVSADRRYVAFRSLATNLVTGDTSSCADIFVRDLVEDTTVRASVSSAEVEADDCSEQPAISADGRFVAFMSAASNLVTDDGNGVIGSGRDIFVRDLVNGTTDRVSVDSSEAEGVGTFTFSPWISADGRYVAFSTDMALDSEDTNNNNDVYVRDRTLGTTDWVSDPGHGSRDSVDPAISDDGRYVSFTTSAALIPSDTNEQNDAYVRDRVTDELVRASVGDGEQEGDGWTEDGTAISANGRSVSFTSGSTNLVSGDTNDVSDVFVRDLDAGTTKQVSVGGANRQVPGGGFASPPSMSADARFVAFGCGDQSIIPGRNSIGCVRDRQKLRTRTFREAEDVPYVLSPTGLQLVFRSTSTSLPGGDGNTENVYLADFPPSSDDVPPVLEGVPGPIVVEATDEDGNVVEYTMPTATDQTDSTAGVYCGPESGETFPIGETTVVCAAADEGGNEDVESFTVTVQDTIPPRLEGPEEIAVEPTEQSGEALVDWARLMSAEDAADDSPQIRCDEFESPDLFPVGTTQVECSATDDSGNSTQKQIAIVVGAGPPPALSISSMRVVERLGIAELQLSLPEAAGSDIELSWQTADGSATAVRDYSPAQGTATIPAGQRFEFISVDLNRDRRDEDTETFEVQVTGAGGLPDVTGTVSIDDDDGPPPESERGTTNGPIVFAGTTDQQSGILKVAEPGGEVELLVPFPIGFLSSISDPSVSPDGRTVLYAFDISDGEVRRRGVAEVAIDGGQSEPIPTDDAPTDPVWRPDGDAFAYIAQGSGAINLVNLAEGTEEPLAFFDSEEPRELSWSPDGTKIAYSYIDQQTASFEIGVVDALDGFVEAPLTQTGDCAERSPSWSPAGDQIAVSLQCGDDHRLGLLPATGGEATGLPLSDPGGSDTQPTWSPDGQRIGFIGEEADGDIQLASVAPAGGDFRVHATPSSAANADWGPSTEGGPPQTNILEGPAGPTGDDTPAFAFTSIPAGGTFECSVDGGAFAPCTSPFTTPPLGDGPRTFAVRATVDGNTDPTPATRSFTVDTEAPPQPVIDSGPPDSTEASTATFAFSGEPGATFRCSLDGGPFQPCTSPYTTPSLLAGQHRFEVQSVDAAQNAGPVMTRTWTIAAQQPPPPPPPVLDDMGLPALTDTDVGVQANVAVVSGTVLLGLAPGVSTARRSGTASQKGVTFVPLTQARQIPIGSFLDTRRGTVRLRSATGAQNGTQTGDFGRGLFQVLQSRATSAGGLTDLVLKGGSFFRRRCGTRGRSSDAGAAQVSRRTVRRLRSNATGRFRTRGRHSAATVRGTVWETTDRCDGTLTKVTRGTVVVRDFRRRRNVVVRAGKRTKGPGGGRGSYLARAR